MPTFQIWEDPDGCGSALVEVLADAPTSRAIEPGSRLIATFDAADGDAAKEERDRILGSRGDTE
jgi:hypothetical protein